MEDIERLIQKGSFGRAERRIRGLLKKNPGAARAYYLWGVIYQDYRNPQRSEEKARQYFEAAIKGDDPVEDAFLSLASLESIASQKIRILRRGTQRCPRSRALYTELLEWSEDKDSEAVFKEMIEKRTASTEAARIMAGKYFTLGKFNEAYHLLSSTKHAHQEANVIDDLLAGYCLLECGDISHALARFESLASIDVTHELGYAPLFGLVTCHLEEGRRVQALAVFEEIPQDSDFSPPYDDRLYMCLYNAYVDQVIRGTSGLLKTTRDKSVVAKARGIRGLMASSCGVLTESKVIADLKAADRVYPANARYCNELRMIAIRQGRWRDAYIYTWRYLRNNASRLFHRGQEDVDSSFVANAADEDFLYMVQDMKRDLGGTGQYWLPYWAIGILIDQVIQRLSKEKKYDLICGLAGEFPQELINNLRGTFNIAYAYDHVGNLRKAEYYYRICETNDPNNSAVVNNLGWVYEQQGDYPTAKKYYLRARELNPDEDIYKRNLSRLAGLEGAQGVFAGESRDTKRCILTLWRQRDVDGFIRGGKLTLVRDVGLSHKRAGEMMTHLVKSSLLVEVRGGQGKQEDAVHQVNPYVLSLLSEFDVEFEHSEAILGVAATITPEALAAIGYTSEVIGALKKVSSAHLQSVLKRDLREAALSLLTQCFKTTLILSGSVIEAILLDRILARGLKAYAMQNGRKKSIQRMALDELLYVAKTQSIIDEQTYHLAHALRGFRNLIHPGVERRKAAIAVSEQNARIAWNITCKLITEC